MISTARSCRYRLLALAAFAAGTTLANGQELQNPRDKANQICASYGPGFIAGSGPGHCVKVQERLRVEPRARHMTLDDSAPNLSSFQEAPLRDRLRVNGGFGNAAVR